MNLTETYTTQPKVVLKTNLITFKVVFDTKKFIEKFKKPSNFYKTFSNSKMTLPNGRTNRDWWKSLKPIGSYHYKIDENTTEIIMKFESKKNINILELKLRLMKLKPDTIQFMDNELDFKKMNKEGSSNFGVPI